MKKRIIWFAVVLLMLSGCSKLSPKQQGEIFFPQGSKGSEWEYLLRITTPSGSQDGRLTISIEGQDTINGKKYNKQTTLMTSTQGQGAQPKINYTRRSKEGIYKVDLADTIKREYLMVPFPMAVGKRWTTQSTGSRLESVAEKIESIEFLGKTYKNCLKISFKGEANSKPIQGYSYFAPEIGETVTNVKMGDVSVMYVLDRYKL
jgi:hypothetical protein